MAKTKNWMHAAGIIWQTLVDAGSSRNTVTYEEVALLINTNPLSVGRALGPIQDYCLENRIAPLTAVVVGKNTGVPGGGFIAWDVDDLDKARDAVAAQNWTLVGNPFAGFGPDDDVESFATQLIANPADAGEVYRRVQNRGLAQRIFRRVLLEAYDWKCAICGLSYSEALDAAHLVPWSDCEPHERLDACNGILLCSSHHRLFDANTFWLSDDMSIKCYDPDASDGEYSDMDRSFVLNFHGSTPALPAREELRPNPAYIRRRLAIRR